MSATNPGTTRARRAPTGRTGTMVSTETHLWLDSVLMWRHENRVTPTVVPGLTDADVDACIGALTEEG